MLIICILANKFQLNQSLIKMQKGIFEIVHTHSFNIRASNNYKSASTKDPIENNPYIT